MSLTIQPVRSRADRETFLSLPWALHRKSEVWVPPLKSAERSRLDPARNPFFEHARAEFFLAREGGRTVGRIAAFIDENHNRVHGEKAGAFGFFESPDDNDVAGALLAAAEKWTVENGADIIRGPLNPSTNDTCGMLIKGFNAPPSVMMPWNPSFHPPLIEAAGYDKAKDLFAYLLVANDLMRKRVDRIAERIGNRDTFRIRDFRLDRFEEELTTLLDIYNDAWENNWGFVPMTEEEVRHMAKELRPVVLPEFVYFVEAKGVPIGFSLALPDINIPLKRCGGRLFPFGWVRFLRPMLRKIPSFRIMALGVRREYRSHGLGPLFYQRYINEGLRRGIRAGEFSWILEDNEMMNRPIRDMGGRPYKVYRIYEKSLSPSGSA